MDQRTKYIITIYSRDSTILISTNHIFLVMHRYEILPMFRLTDVTFPILADTDNRSDISITSKSANNRHHYAIKLLLNVFEHHP